MFDEILANTVTHFEWDLFVLILVIISGPLILERFRLPGLLGLVLGGMLVGPYVLGWLEQGDLDALAGIGLLYMMFLAGAELDLNLFQRIRNAAATFGLLAFSIPLVLGMIVGLLLDLSWPAAILMGSMWASNTLIAYSIIRTAGLTNNKAIATVVGATLITDTLALVVLSIVASAYGDAQGASGVGALLPILRLIIGFVVLVIYCLVLLPRIGRWFFAGPGQQRIQRFLFVLAALASAGLLAKLGGIEGLVGAFFAGVGLNRLLPNEGRLMKQVEFFGMAFFIPAFLVSVGMLINPAVLFSIQTLLLAAAFMVALTVGKLIASLIAGRLFKYSRPEMGVMFSLTITQAAATLATVMVGTKIGLLEDDIVNAVLLVVIVSLVATSIGTRFFTSKIKPEKVDVPPIGESVIVPVFPSQSLCHLMSVAADIVEHDAGIITPVVVVPEHDLVDVRLDAENLLLNAEDECKAVAADVVGKLRVDSTIHDGIVRELEEQSGSLVLVEWQRDPTAHQLLFGHEIDHIGATSPVPVSVIRFSGEKITRITLASGVDDGSTGYQIDLQVCVDLAERLAISGHLPLLHLSTEGVDHDIDIQHEETEAVEVQPGIEGIISYLQAGDLVILPAATMGRKVSSHASRLFSEVNEMSVMLAAGPHRLNLTGVEVGKDTAAIMNLSTSS